MAFMLTYDEKLKKDIWYGDRLKKEIIYIDENGKKQTSISYQDPIEIIANFNPDTKISLASPEVSTEARKKFGGDLKGFVWLDKIVGGGEIVLPFTASHIFKATGSKDNPILTEIYTNPAEDDYYEVIDNKTHVHVSSFSGVGGAAGAPPTLIVHWKMNEDAANKVVADSSGNSHTGASIQNTEDIHVTGKINGALAFDGTGDYVKRNISDFRSGDSSGTISVWVKKTVAGGAILGSFDEDSNEKYLLLNTDGGYVIVGKDAGVVDVYHQLDATTTVINDGQWHHIILLSTGSEWKIYVDTILQTLNIVAGDNDGDWFGDIESGRDNLTIGGFERDVGLEAALTGQIDNVKLFSVELSLDEIKRLYNNGHGTEILSEVDEPRLLLRRNNSPFGLRSRYEV